MYVKCKVGQGVDYLKKPTQDFKKLFCFKVSVNPRTLGRLHWEEFDSFCSGIVDLKPHTQHKYQFPLGHFY